MTFSSIPEQLTHDRIYRWCVFRCYFYPDKINKVPYQPNGVKARIDDKSTWSNFKTCMKAIEFGIGHLPGLAITPEFKIACVDLDHCIENGEYSKTAQKYISAFKDKAYIEKSISGNGVHIFFWYTGKEAPPIHPEKGVELYTNDRFMAITGDSSG